MVHIAAAIYLLGIIAGTVAVSCAALFYAKYRKPVIRHFLVFIIGLYAILLGFLLSNYRDATGLVSLLRFDQFIWLLRASGSMTIVVIGPFFYHSLIGVVISRRFRVALFFFDSAVAVVILLFIFFPNIAVLPYILSGALFAVIIYGLIFIAIHLPHVVDPLLKRAILTFLLLTIVFVPLLALDIFFEPTESTSPLFFDNLTQPVYFLILSILATMFGMKYLNRPAYYENGKLSDYFIERFDLTPRESEVLERLLAGDTAAETAETLFISPKTAENHIYNIYQKLGVKNRLHLLHFIRSNESEQ